jgi:putative hydrolase of the HAD superfamily
MILVFDLDDTLYSEIEFVQSGFSAVSSFLTESYGIKPVYNRMLEIFNEYGRGKVFDIILKESGVFTRKTVRKCISIYRYHEPKIHLHNSSILCIQRFADTHKYIVTDGNKYVQENKVRALGLYPLFNGVYISRKYGVNKEKPSPYCFDKICKEENVSPDEVVYIGDNPHKDFVGIKPLGFRTVRIRQGNYINTRLSPEYEAEYEITNFDEVNIENLREAGIWH